MLLQAQGGFPIRRPPAAGRLLAALALAAACAASPCGLVAGFSAPPRRLLLRCQAAGWGSSDKPPPVPGRGRRLPACSGYTPGRPPVLNKAAAPGGRREEEAAAVFSRATTNRRDLLLSAAAAAALAAGARPARAAGEPAPGTRAFLRVTLKLVADGLLEEAEGRLTRSIASWDKDCPLELAVLYKYRGDVRTNLGQLPAAVSDFTLSLEALQRAERPDAPPESVSVDGTLCVEETDDPTKQFCIYVPAQSDLYLRRARVSMLLKNYSAAEESFSRVIAIAEEEGTRNPWALLYRGDAAMGGGAYERAEGDYAAAVREFRNIGDGVTAEVARAGRALALYGQGKVGEAVKAMSEMVLRTPSVTGDLELLLSLSDKEAEMHAALATHYWSEGRGADAEGEWDRACVRMDAMNEFAAKRIAASPYDRKGEDGKVLKAYLPTNLVGCKRYREREYVVGSKMWPPALADRMEAFFSKKR